MVVLLVPTSLDQLLFILKIILFKKQDTLIRRLTVLLTVLSLPPQLVFSGFNNEI
jgi:hypothetical protein